MLRWKVQSLSRSRLFACLGPPCCVEVEHLIVVGAHLGGPQDVKYVPILAHHAM